MSQIERREGAQFGKPAALELELAAIDRQQRRFNRLSLLAIVVSFVHMAAALALFSGEAWYELAAALAMTALVDVATWALAGYFDYAARRQLARSIWIKATFGFALAISMFLNGAYLYANRPPDLPGWMSVGVAIAFAVFVPMLIGVASLIRGELEADRLGLQQLSIQQQASVELAPLPPEPKPAATPTLPARPRPRRAALPAERESGSGLALPEPFTALPESTRTERERTAPLEPFAAPLEDARTNGDGPVPPEPFAALPQSARTEAAAQDTGELFANETIAQSANDEPAAGARANEAISTGDVPAIVAALRRANVRQFANARALARTCGWSSSSSGPKALKALLAAGAVRETANGFELLEPGEEVRPTT